MIRYTYLAILLFSFAGVASWDLSVGPHLIIRRPAWRAIICTAIFLLVADIIGIRLGIFMTNPAYVSGIFLGSPNLPLEEPILLLFISYLSLLTGELIKR